MFLCYRQHKISLKITKETVNLLLNGTAIFFKHLSLAFVISVLHCKLQNTFNLQDGKLNNLTASLLSLKGGGGGGGDVTCSTCSFTLKGQKNISVRWNC